MSESDNPTRQQEQHATPDESAGIKSEPQGGGLKEFFVPQGEAQQAPPGPQQGGDWPAPTPQARGASGYYMPEYDPDVAASEQPDLLNMQREVHSLSALLAARDTEPPLSLGLFGDWGTGTTFFMEKLHAQVDRFADQGGPTFCQGIAQIRFNAWHYVESNLWASLIATIFDRLEAEISRREDNGEQKLQALRDQWQSTLQRQRLAEQELHVLADKLAGARRERDALLSEKQAAEAKVKKVRKKTDRKVSSLEDRAQKQLEDTMREAGDELGLPELKQTRDLGTASIGDVITVLGEAKDVGKRAWSFVRMLASSLTWRQVVLGLLIILTPIAILAVVGYVSGDIKGMLAHPMAVVAEIAVVLGTATQWARGKIRRANDVLDKLEQAHRSLLGERDSEMNEAQSEVDELEKQLEDKQAEVAMLVTDQEHVKRALAEFTPARRMAAFLSDRRDSQDYRRHLGLIALIREDFENLSRLLAAQGDKRDAALPQIERIVLYIDDLDRCPPDRVVELLQAIHLLLAFRLFVVVVAVDVRWVSRALVKFYDGFLCHPWEISSDQNPATSHDYLEKIFQIPFWIRPMGPQSGADMINGILDRNRPATGATGQPTRAAFDPSRLEIYPAERRMMIELAAIAGRSPRAVKRFINVFRLLKASLPVEKLAQFEPDANGRGEYRPMLLALAILIGYPRIADDLFEELKTGANTKVKIAKLLKTLGDKARDRADADDWAKLSPQVEQFCKVYSITVQELRECAGYVARYSFRIVPY